jgi:hypothetical protein
VDFAFSGSDNRDIRLPKYDRLCKDIDLPHNNLPIKIIEENPTRLKKYDRRKNSKRWLVTVNERLRLFEIPEPPTFVWQSGDMIKTAKTSPQVRLCSV